MKKAISTPAFLVFAALLAPLLFSADAPPAAPAAYSNDFEKAQLGKAPDEFMALNGEYAVVQVEKNKCLELTPDPIDGDGFLFGPPGVTTGTVSARIWAAASGKRFPEFGIGANDAGGYKLVVVPALGTIELRKGDDAVASAPFTWKSETWTRLRLHIGKTAAGTFQVEAKAWADGSAEPKEWMISATDKTAPSPGRASAWGMPYSEKPIRFDDLAVDPK
ncbi:MAG TPA: hypothetical protein VFE47_17295 [Tepidisphaeraceae bacterium]|jgi:hypothetical protein|nr:hypothetical protein [Tepidisphaeraceae bacterium]